MRPGKAGIQLLALLGALATTAPRVAAQPGATAPADSVPTLDELNVRILTLKVQAQTLRARLSEAQGDVLPAGAGSQAWRDSVAAIGAGAAALRTRSAALRAGYERVANTEGTRIARDLGALAARLARAIDGLAAARDPAAARMQITHVSAQLDAMRERLTTAERCCRLNPKERGRS